LQIEQVFEKVRLEEERHRLNFQLSTENLIMEDERRRRMDVLRQLGYIDAESVIELKGKVACEVHEQELLITELMLENKLAGRSCAEIAALLSPITCQFQAKSLDGREDSPREEETEGSSLTRMSKDLLKEVIRIYQHYILR
jgi:antiviral helicase SKI2